MYAGSCSPDMCISWGYFSGACGKPLDERCPCITRPSCILCVAHRQGLESADQEGWQSFDLTGYDGEFATEISLVIKGTGSGAPGFQLLDARFIGEAIDNPTDELYVSGGTSC